MVLGQIVRVVQINLACHLESWPYDEQTDCAVQPEGVLSDIRFLLVGFVQLPFLCGCQCSSCLTSLAHFLGF